MAAVHHEGWLSGDPVSVARGTPGATPPRSRLSLSLSTLSCLPRLCPDVLHYDTAATRPSQPKTSQSACRWTESNAEPCPLLQLGLGDHRERDFRVLRTGGGAQPRRRALLSPRNEPTPRAAPIGAHSPFCLLHPSGWGTRRPLAQPQSCSGQGQGLRCAPRKGPASAPQWGWEVGAQQALLRVNAGGWKDGL